MITFGKMGDPEPQKDLSLVHVCTLQDLAGADAVIFRTPARFGNMCKQMRQFFDVPGSVWKADRWGRSLERVYQIRDSALRAGIDDPDCSHDTSPLWHDHPSLPYTFGRAAAS